jgi:SAM-dependent methyltransferase
MTKEGLESGIPTVRDKRRDRLLRGLNIQESVGVEIGPLCWPLVRRSEAPNVIYVDHTDTPSLRQKYKDDPHLDVNEIVDVDAVWGRNTLHEAIKGRYVDYVVASHVVEHVPDLVTWLRELAAVLRPTGEVRLAVPDRRLFPPGEPFTGSVDELYCPRTRAASLFATGSLPRRRRRPDPGGMARAHRSKFRQAASHLARRPPSCTRCLRERHIPRRPLLGFYAEFVCEAHGRSLPNGVAGLRLRGFLRHA